MPLSFGNMSSLFPQSSQQGEGLGAAKQQELIQILGTGSQVPLGAILPWCKSLTNTPALPDGWAECNGQVLVDGDSIYNGITMPDLNGAVAAGLKGRFLRGNSSSGEIENSQNLSHTHSININSVGGSGEKVAYPGALNNYNYAFNSSASGGSEARPYNYSVVFIMRIK